MPAPPSRSEDPAQFQPLRPATRRVRRVGYLAGSLAWVVALGSVAVVAGRADTIGVALAVVLVSFLIGLAFSLGMRRGRDREEEQA